MDAECLLAEGHIAGAYYLGGYAVELALKVVVCKKLNIEIFDKDVVPGHIAKAFMIHDLSDLIILSGLSDDLQKTRADNDSFSESWSLISM